MSYSAGIQHHRVTFARRLAAQQSRFGLDAQGVQWLKIGTFWANVTWKKGMKEMREGALDAYDFIMVRLDWQPDIDRECILKYDGRWYQIESCYRDYEANTIQITAREMANSTADLYETMILATSDSEALTTADNLALAAKVKIE